MDAQRRKASSGPELTKPSSSSINDASGMRISDSVNRLSEEQKSVPSLRRALKDVAMEKDAAAVAGSLKKRLKEAEEEQGQTLIYSLEDVSDKAAQKEFPREEDEEKREKQLHDMAVSCSS